MPKIALAMPTMTTQARIRTATKTTLSKVNFARFSQMVPLAMQSVAGLMSTTREIGWSRGVFRA
jgi:hypothetical protein